MTIDEIHQKAKKVTKKFKTTFSKSNQDENIICFLDGKEKTKFSLKTDRRLTWWVSDNCKSGFQEWGRNQNVQIA